MGLAVAGDDGNDDDDERRDGEDGQVSLLRWKSSSTMETEVLVAGLKDSQRLSLNRTQPLHKATLTGVSQLYNQIAWQTCRVLWWLCSRNLRKCTKILIMFPNL